MIQKKTAVLIIHGFGGSLWETEYILNYLEYNTNYNIYSFTLPGHEKSRVKGVKYDDWINASKNKINYLIKRYKKIYVIGHSMGGVIASCLAAEYEEIKRLVLISPAFIYGNVKQNKADIKEILKTRKKYKETYKEAIYSDLIKKIFRLPIKTFKELNGLIKKYFECPSKIKCPTLLLHGTIDEVVPIKSSEYVYNTIKSKKKYFTLIEKTKHRVLISNRIEEICEYISIFLKGGTKWKQTKKSKI